MEIFPSSNLRDRVVEYILLRPASRIKITAIATGLGAGKGHVSEIIRSLGEAGVVKHGMVDLGSPYVRSLKIAINMNRVCKAGILQKLKRLGITRAGIYGSWARGSNTEDSDLDMWIIAEGRMTALEIARLSAEVGRALDTNPEILVLDKGKLAGIRKSNEIFYFSLVFGSLVLIGEEIERLG